MRYTYYVNECYKALLGGKNYVTGKNLLSVRLQSGLSFR